MQDTKERVALGSIVASAGLCAAKALVGALSGSLAILSEAAHSLIDLAATIMTYFAIRVSGKPADAEHHYGHGKIESVAALAETALLFFLSAVIIWEALHRLFGDPHHAVEASIAAFLVIGFSIGIDFFRARLLNRVARDTASEALAADALHFSSDMWSSIAVLVGLGGVAWGFPAADALAALIVALFVCLAGWRLGKRTIDTLTDTAPEGVAERITDIARHTKGVVAVERVRVRPSGPVLFVDLAVAVNRTLPLDRVAMLKDALVRTIHSQLPEAELTISTSPRALDNESVLESVMVIARNRGLAVHHVTVQDIAGRLAVSLDLEVNGDLALGTAHDIATNLEQAIVEELGLDVEVETHIEPLQAQGLDGRDAQMQRVTEVRVALAELALTLGPLRDIHDVRVRETAEGEIVNFHCQVDTALTVHEVHEKVDEVERALRRQWPTIKRVIGHAEPTRPSTPSPH
ncbi:MAG TPA: cation diffusion facilitator family transporter [Xanthobacteraceae bacterium]|jgi:cation diffusion facilitator family transporter|nr:cation diffusion facilitator family transporter [Xanthobacteraceae bacterium]